MANAFESVSDEVLMLLFSFLPPINAYSVSLTCKRLSYIINGVLYLLRHVTIHSGCPKSFPRGKDEPQYIPPWVAFFARKTPPLKNLQSLTYRHLHRGALSHLDKVLAAYPALKALTLCGESTPDWNSGNIYASCTQLQSLGLCSWDHAEPFMDAQRRYEIVKCMPAQTMMGSQLPVLVPGFAQLTSLDLTNAPVDISSSFEIFRRCQFQVLIFRFADSLQPHSLAKIIQLNGPTLVNLDISACTAINEPQIFLTINKFCPVLRRLAADRCIWLMEPGWKELSGHAALCEISFSMWRVRVDCSAGITFRSGFERDGQFVYTCADLLTVIASYPKVMYIAGVRQNGDVHVIDLRKSGRLGVAAAPFEILPDRMVPVGHTVPAGYAVVSTIPLAVPFYEGYVKIATFGVRPSNVVIMESFGDIWNNCT